jgi:hypothetical protein
MSVLQFKTTTKKSWHITSWVVGLCQNLILQMCSSRYGNNFFRQKLKRSAALMKIFSKSHSNLVTFPSLFS